MSTKTTPSASQKAVATNFPADEVALNFFREFYIRLTLHRNKFIYNKTNLMH
jgi:hypothetical protein